MMNKRILARLEELRRALVTADGDEDGAFPRVFHAFFDIADDPALIAGSKPTKNAPLRLALDRLLVHLTDDTERKVQQVRMLRVAAAGMIHGGCLAPGWMGTFFYFEREQRGLVAFRGGGLMAHYMRISLTEVPPDGFPAPGPAGTQ